MSLKIKHMFLKNAILFRRNPHPFVLLFALIIVLVPITSVYSHIDSWNLRVGIVNDDAGHDGMRYSLFLTSELDVKEVNFTSLNAAEKAAEAGEIDAIVYIHKDFSDVIYRIIQGNETQIYSPVVDIYSYSKYPQVKMALASKIKSVYEKFTSSQGNIATYKDMESNTLFTFYGLVLLISFILSYYYTLLFIFKDWKGPFYWRYFKRLRGLLSLSASYILFFYILLAPITAVLWYMYSLPIMVLTWLFVPLMLTVIISVFLALFTAAFIKRESSIYYITPVMILLGIISSGVAGPEKYMPLYLKLIYEAFPISVEIFYGTPYHVIRTLSISATLFIVAVWIYLRKKR